MALRSIAPTRRPARPAPAVEALEDRRLMAASFQSAFAVPLTSVTDEGARAVAVDAAGNTIIAGTFKGTVDFGPGAGTPGDTLAATGSSRDVFVAKYDPAGALLWARRAGAGGADEGRGVAVDPAGNVYVTGSFSGDVDFSGDGAADLSAPSGADLFVWKLTADGGFAYAASAPQVAAGGQAQAIGGSAIAVDAAGAAYVTGRFGGTLTVPGLGELTGPGPFTNLFVLRLDPSGGSFTLARQFAGTTTGFREAHGVAVDPAGDIYVTGTFAGTVDFDPTAATPGDTLTAPGGVQNAFVARLTSAGALAYARQVVGGRYGVGLEVQPDAAGNAYLTGVFQGAVDLDPGAGDLPASRPGLSLGQYLLKLDPAGSLAWATDLGTTDDLDERIGDDVNATTANRGLGNGGLALDDTGLVHVAGSFLGTAIVGSRPLVSVNGSKDAFVATYRPDGRFVDAAQLGGSRNDLAEGLDAVPGGGVRIVGGYTGPDFAAGPLTLPTSQAVAIYAVGLRTGVGAGMVDFDGNGVSDLGVFSIPDARWDVELSDPAGNKVGDRDVNYGIPGDFAVAAGLQPLTDFPIPGDYNGDGITDRALFRIATAEYIVQYLDAQGNVIPGSSRVYQFGFPGDFAVALGMEPLVDIPIPGDYNGDGVYDLAVFRVPNAEWIIRFKRPGFDFAGNLIAGAEGARIVQHGIPGTVAEAVGIPPLADMPVPGDYNGDGVTDFGVYRRVSDAGEQGRWLIRLNDAAGNRIGTRIVDAIWGLSDDPTVRAGGGGIEVNVPVPGDYDGNGTTDVAVWHAPTADWRIILLGADGTIVNRPDDGASNTRRKTFRRAFDPVAPAWRRYPDVPLSAPFSSLIKLGVLPGIPRQS